MSPTSSPPSAECASASPRGDWSDATIDLAGGEHLAVRLYGRKVAGQASPLVVHFHGGTFVSGGLDNGSMVAGLLQQSGAVVVSVAYPLAPFPQPVEQGYQALQWAFRHRTRLAGAGAPVYVAGEEAGGNLAAAVSLVARDQSHPPLAGRILLSPMLDPCVGTASARQASGAAACSKWVDGWANYLRCPRDAEHPYAVPAGTSRMADIAPTLIMVGDTDPMHDEALAYAERLRAAGRMVVQHVFAKVEQWPEPLLEPAAHECPCADAARSAIRAFFDATRC